MKNLLYIIAILLIIIWAIVFLSFQVHPAIHVLLIAAGLIILFRLMFGRYLSPK